jgi:hypothetical protein
MVAERMRRKWTWTLVAAIALCRTAAAAPPQVTDLSAFHRAGQTFLTFAEPGPAPPEKMTWGQVRQALTDSKDSFRIYASDGPITAANLAAAELAGEVRRFSGWNLNGRNVEYLIGQAMIQPDKTGELAQRYNGLIYTWHMGHPRMDRYPLDRLVINAQAGPLPPGTGLFVAHPAKAGKRYYAVISVSDGVANQAEVSAANSLAQPVAETVGPGEPVRQGKGLSGPFHDYPGDRWVYVQWTGPPTTPAPMYFNWSVLLPPDCARPAPVELYFHDGNYSYAKPNRKLMAGSIQIAPHDFPPSGWYGYNDAVLAGKDPAAGTVGNHTQKRIVAFLQWAMKALPVDADRIIAVGADGAAMLAVNYPELFAYAVITGFDRQGVLEPKAAGRFAAAWGPKGPIKDDRDRAEWSWADLDKLVLAEPAKDLPMFVCKGASWGRVPGWGKGRGRLYSAMHQARQALFAHWAWGGKLVPPDKYTQLWRGLDVRRDSPVPAIANSTLDKEGEGGGNTNMAYSWKDVKDTADAFEMTILGRPSKFDLTPRRLRRFKVKAGQTLRWQGTYVRSPRARSQPAAPAGGKVTVDEHGRITLAGLELVKDAAGLKITITKAE